MFLLIVWSFLFFFAVLGVIPVVVYIRIGHDDENIESVWENEESERTKGITSNYDNHHPHNNTPSMPLINGK